MTSLRLTSGFVSTRILKILASEEAKELTRLQRQQDLEDMTGATIIVQPTVQSNRASKQHEAFHP